MTIICDVIPDIDLSLVPDGTTITVLSRFKFNPNTIEVKVSHHDELVLLRLVQQTWGFDSDQYSVLDLI
jgi:hypothetical protein